MKIVVVGAGSIGTLFGSILFNSGQDVTLVEKKPEIVQAIQKNGLKMIRGKEEQVLPIKITSQIEDVPNPDLIMFTVKSYDNIKAAHDCLKIIGTNTIVLTLQNGIGNYEVISEIIGAERTVVGTTTFGSTQFAPGCTRGSETGVISIGEYAGGLSPRIWSLAKTLTEGGFTIQMVEDVNSLIWTKLAVNVGINAIGALCRIRNIFTHDIEPAGEVQKLAVEEVKKVAAAKGIQLDYDHLYDHVVDVCYTTRDNKCSMYQDVESKNLTEVAAINGAIVDEGKKLGIDTPVNFVLTKLVKATEAGYQLMNTEK